MNIVISTVSQSPVYEQIKSQIREQVLLGELASETMLPSIRALARELKVGVITVKRAYDDLCIEGVLFSKPGKGVYVSELNSEYIKETHLGIIKDQLRDIKRYANEAQIGLNEIIELLKQVYREDNHE